MAKQLLIGDLHFGIYSNSVLWLESQIKYVNYILDTIKQILDLHSIVILGDVFDIRYSTNCQVGCEVKKLFRKFNSLNIPTYIISGNHDYYSPLEINKEYNTYDLIFGEEFYHENTNLHFIINESFYDQQNCILYLPWYEWDNQDTLYSLLDKYPFTKTIYCHGDMEATFNNEELKNRLKNITVFSGHIHYPWHADNLHNIGAALSLTFNDVNSDRYFYVVENNVIINKYRNDITMKFKRYYNEEIFSLTEDSFKNCKTELMISRNLVNTARYVEQLKFIKNEFSDYQITRRVIDDIAELKNVENIRITNINTYIENNIPENLKSKYELIKNKIYT